MYEWLYLKIFIHSLICSLNAIYTYYDACEERIAMSSERRNSQASSSSHVHTDIHTHLKFVLSISSHTCLFKWTYWSSIIAIVIASGVMGLNYDVTVIIFRTLKPIIFLNIAHTAFMPYRTWYILSRLYKNIFKHMQ